MPAAEIPGQVPLGQLRHMPAIEQAGERIGGCQVAQLVGGQRDDVQIEERQVAEHGEHHAEVEQVNRQQGIPGDGLQGGRDEPHHAVQRHIEAPQANQGHQGGAQGHGDKQSRDKHQQVIMKATFPANQECAQGRVEQHLTPDQDHGQAILAPAQCLVGQDVDADTDDIDPGQDGRVQGVEKEKERHIHHGGNLAATLGDTPELRAPFTGERDGRALGVTHRLGVQMAITQDYAAMSAVALLIL